MRFKNTLKTAVALSLGLGLSLLSLPARAQTGTPIAVNGNNYVPVSGTTISTVADNAYPVRISNGGRLFGADNWTLSTSGNGAYVVYLTGTSSFSGTNLNISTTGTAHGMYANTSSTITLASSTVTTTGTGAYGLFIQGTSSMSVSGVDISTSGSNSRGVYVIDYSTFSGTNLNVHTTGSTSYGLYATTTSTVTLVGGTIATEGDAGHGLLIQTMSSATASDMSISTSGSNARGVYVSATASFSGTNLNIKISGSNAYALSASGDSSLKLTGGTLSTTDASSGGVVVATNGTATLSNVTVNVAGDLVNSTNDNAGTNTVLLDNVRGTNGTDVLHLGVDAATVANTTNLTIQNSALKGNLSADGMSTGNVNLVSGTLTGAANKVGSSALNVSVDGASKWNVTASSTLTSLTNQGVVDMHTGGALRQMTVDDFTQSAGASIAMTLAGNGGVANELVNVNGQLTLAGALVLNGYAGLAAASSVDGGSFVLFAGAASVSGAFTDIQLNGVSYGAIADGASFTDAAGYTYTLSYHGDAATGALTGGNDVLLHVIPEPGTWAMLVGGFGLLLAGQRLRRRSRG